MAILGEGKVLQMVHYCALIASSYFFTSVVEIGLRSLLKKRPTR